MISTVHVKLAFLRIKNNPCAGLFFIPPDTAMSGFAQKGEGVRARSSNASRRQAARGLTVERGDSAARGRKGVDHQAGRRGAPPSARAAQADRVRRFRPGGSPQHCRAWWGWGGAAAV